MTRRFELTYREYADDDTLAHYGSPTEHRFEVSWENGSNPDVMENLNRFLRLLGLDRDGYRVVQEISRDDIQEPGIGRGDSFPW